MSHIQIHKVTPDSIEGLLTDGNQLNIPVKLTGKALLYCRENPKEISINPSRIYVHTDRHYSYQVSNPRMTTLMNELILEGTDVSNHRKTQIIPIKQIKRLWCDSYSPIAQVWNLDMAG